MTAKPSDRAVVVRRRLKAPPAVVYRVWTDAKHAARWSWGEDYATVAISIDCRVGGVWRQQVRNNETGEVWSFEGEFREVVPNAKLVHTFHWRSDGGKDEGVSLVSIEFVSYGEETDVAITHTQLKTEHRKGTTTGWEDVLNMVERCLA
jgi:uncharacterized protein YndB with AHSA1/START domain